MTTQRMYQHEDLPLFSGQAPSNSRYDGRGYRPATYYRQLRLEDTASDTNYVTRQWTEQEMDIYHRRCQYVNATLENGDKANGCVCWEDGFMWFGAIDANGQEYETRELPHERIDLTNLTYIAGTPQSIMQQPGYGKEQP